MVLQFRNTVPSLTSIAAVKTTTLLWNRVHSFPAEDCSRCNDYANYMDDHYPFPAQHYSHCYNFAKNMCQHYPLLYIWQDINKVKDSVRYLKLPKFLEEEILCLVDFIGSDIRRWLSYMCTDEIRSSTSVRVKFFWTQTGTIDNKKTAEVLVKDKRFAAYIRYEIACIFCLEEDCKILWKEMNEGQRNKYCNASCSTRPEVIYWTNIITGYVTGLHDIYDIGGLDACTLSHFAFVEAAKRCNVVATQYFFTKLTPEERKKSLVSTTTRMADDCSSQETYPADVIIFLLLQMDDEELEEVLTKCADGIIESLMDWRWENLLLDILNQIWPFINKDVFYNLLESIAEEQDSNCEKCVNRYKQLFSDVLNRVPVTLKSDFVNEILTKYSLLWTLLRKDDLTNIKLILKDATEEVKKDFLSSNIGNFICNRFLDDENWCALELIIKACVTSKREVTEFERKFRRNGILEEAERDEKIMKNFREMLSKVESEIEQGKL